MLIAGFDTETTGTNTESDHIVQVGAVLWDTDSRKKKAKLKFDSVIKGDHLTEIPQAASEVNGLTMEDVNNYGAPIESVFHCLHTLFARADAIMAFNGNAFDRPIYLSTCKRFGIEPAKKVWIDARYDIPYRPDVHVGKLKEIAVDHDFLNPFPHDAISDVLTMLKIADKYDWSEIMKLALQPTFVLKADMPFTKDEMFGTRKDEFAKMKDLVKAHGFHFEAATKTWEKSIKEHLSEKARTDARDGGYKLKLVRKENINADVASTSA